jgi:hypothetical protein
MMGSWVEVNGWETMVDGKIEVMGRKSFTEGKKVQGGLFPLYTQVTWRLTEGGIRGLPPKPAHNLPANPWMRLSLLILFHFP